MSKKVKILLIASSLILFTIVLFNNCYSTDGKDDTVGSIGLIAFLLGWMNASETFIVWFANPLFFLALILLFLHKTAALITASIAFILALSFQLFDEVLINEGGTVGKIDALAIGYWLWLASIGLLLLTAIINYNTADKIVKQQQGI